MVTWYRLFIKDLVCINPEVVTIHKNKVILSAGTDLGKCIVAWDSIAHHYVVVPSEGGHVDFPVHNQEEFSKESVMSERVATYPIERIILDRWSRRAMSGESIGDQELMRIFEAARWAPSAHNDQPWRFIYAHKGSATWQMFFATLSDFNKTWAKNAAVLVLLVSKKIYEWNRELPNPYYSFDAGTAWQNVALQACAMNLSVRCMADFDRDKVRQDLGIPDDVSLEVMIALGKPGKKEDLSSQLQEREYPSDRKPLEEIVFKDKWKR
jgi:nitroreductase